jgi:hypothetical protein
MRAPSSAADVPAVVAFRAECQLWVCAVTRWRFSPWVQVPPGDRSSLGEIAWPGAVQKSDYRHHGAAARACGERPCRRRTPAVGVMNSRRCMSAPKLRRGFLSCSNERFDRGRGLNQVQYVLKRHRVLLLLPSVSSQSTSEAVSNQEAAAILR